MMLRSHLFSFFFFNDTATTEIYTLSLHDALPIYSQSVRESVVRSVKKARSTFLVFASCSTEVENRLFYARGKYQEGTDRKSTRLNSSHQIISYAVFCLKKKKTISNICHDVCVDST